jgi:hypothetical protein
MSSVSPLFPEFQGGCRREWLRTKDNGYKMEAGMPSFSTAFSEFVGPSKESVLLSKISLSSFTLRSGFRKANCGEYCRLLIA